MMQLLKKLFLRERRGYPRKRVNGIFDLVGPVNRGRTIKRKVNMINVSPGGAAFIYEGSPDDLPRLGLISLSNDVCVGLGFETVSDVQYPGRSNYRRRGVKFDYIY